MFSVRRRKYGNAVVTAACKIEVNGKTDAVAVILKRDCNGLFLARQTDDLPAVGNSLTGAKQHDRQTQKTDERDQTECFCHLFLLMGTQTACAQ